MKRMMPLHPGIIHALIHTFGTVTVLVSAGILSTLILVGTAVIFVLHDKAGVKDDESLESLESLELG